jgi:SAM-dependent methyltransferase
VASDIGGREVNMLNIQEKQRDYSRGITDDQRRVMSRFGNEYFDDPDYPGYGGYVYNGVWTEAAKEFGKYFDLQDGANILDVGCGKGFLLYDLKMANPSFNVHGVDISEYAVSQAEPLVRANIKAAGCTDLPYPDSMFDLVISASTIHNLPEADARQAVREINRVGRDHRFIMVHSYRNEGERKNLINWEATIQLVLSVDGWRQLFMDEGYTGSYWFQTFP